MSLFVGNLSNNTKESDLELFFGKYGKIEKIIIAKGYGTVKFEKYEDADNAVLELNGEELLGRMIKVEHYESFFLDMSNEINTSFDHTEAGEKPGIIDSLINDMVVSYNEMELNDSPSNLFEDEAPHYEFFDSVLVPYDKQDLVDLPLKLFEVKDPYCEISDEHNESYFLDICSESFIFDYTEAGKIHRLNDSLSSTFSPYNKLEFDDPPSELLEDEALNGWFHSYARPIAEARSSPSFSRKQSCSRNPIKHRKNRSRRGRFLSKLSKKRSQRKKKFKKMSN